MWCTLVGYMQDANCLYYLHKSGHTSQCNMARLVHPQYSPPSSSIILQYMVNKMYVMSMIMCVILWFYVYVLPMSIYIDYKLVAC